MSNQTIDTLVEALSQLSVLDMAKLKTALEDKWGVKAAVAAAPASAGWDGKRGGQATIARGARRLSSPAKEPASPG